jgi:hypothetical protein
MGLAVLLVEQSAYGMDLDLDVVEVELVANIPMKRSKTKTRKNVPGATETPKLSAQVLKKREQR